MRSRGRRTTPQLKKEKEMSEKRRAERISSKLFVNIRAGTDKSLVGRGVVIDVSAIGLAIETEGSLNVGETYECNVEIPLRLKAKVVRTLHSCHMKRYGMELMGQNFIDKLLF